MTTQVKVIANHGCPVVVWPISIGGQAAAEPVRVPVNETRDFYVHSGQDLLISEVQPGERDEAAHSLALVETVSLLAEERLLQLMDALRKAPDTVDQRWLALARTQIELGFMALYRAIARPKRISLPEDEA